MFGIKNISEKSIQILPCGFCIFKRYQYTFLEYLVLFPVYFLDSIKIIEQVNYALQIIHNAGYSYNGLDSLDNIMISSKNKVYIVSFSEIR